MDVFPRTALGFACPGLLSACPSRAADGAFLRRPDMNPLPASRRLCLLLLLAMPLQAADHMAHFVPQSGSRVTIDGTSNLHDWRIEGQVINGLVQFGAGFPLLTGQKVNLGKIQARMEGSIPIRSLHSVGEGNVMDNFICLQLNERTNPSAFFRISELILKTAPKSKGFPYLFDSRCDLVLAGVTNQTSMPVRIISLSGNKLKIIGSTSFKMTDFGIQPPRWHASDSTINVGDTVKLRFEWLVRLKRNV